VKKISKILALLLAVGMILGLAACGPKNDPSAPTPTPSGNTETPAPATTPAPADDVDPDAIPDNMTSADNKYQVAFITDVGQLKDKSFNQGTYDGVKLYANANNLSYKYYQPSGGDQATDDDRYNAMKAAVDGGAEVVVCAGFMQEAALRKAAMEFTDVPFIFIDGYPLTEDPTKDDSPVLPNVAGISFQEEQCGYFAGYAVVKEGFTKLGFSGGGSGTNPACCRFGYGFVQGANAAAAELGIQVDMNYSWQYGASFQASAELQSMISGWYETGTEVVFACGGSMFQSISAAASANDGYVVGVDVDQSGESPAVITSAMKGLSDAAQWAIAKVYDNTFGEIGGNGTSLGVAQNSVGLPTSTWSLENFSVADYEALFQDVLSRKVTIDSDYNNLESTTWSNLTLKVI